MHKFTPTLIFKNEIYMLSAIEEVYTVIDTGFSGIQMSTYILQDITCGSLSYFASESLRSRCLVVMGKS
jgi:hypothetical protein